MFALLLTFALASRRSRAERRHHNKYRPRTAVNDLLGDGIIEDTDDNPNKPLREWQSIVKEIDPTEMGETDIDHHDIEDYLYNRKKRVAEEPKEDPMETEMRRTRAKKKLSNQVKQHFVGRIRDDLRGIQEKVHTKMREDRIRNMMKNLN